MALLDGHCCHWSTGLQFVGCTLIGRQTRVVEIMIQGLGHLRPTTESACLLYGTRLHNLTNSFWILFKTAIKWPDYIVCVVGAAAPSRIITIERAPVGRVVMANMKRPVRNGPTITVVAPSPIAKMFLFISFYGTRSLGHTATYVDQRPVINCLCCHCKRSGCRQKHNTAHS